MPSTLATTTILRGVPVQLDSTPGVKGSCARVGAGGGKSIVGIGAKTTSILAGQSAVLTFVIREAGHIDRLFLAACIPAAGGTAPLDCATVTNITYDNDNLTSGDLPATMFEKNAEESPIFGHYVEVNHELQMTIRNEDLAAPLTISAGFSVA
jgi:hypothetical protein